MGVEDFALAHAHERVSVSVVDNDYGAGTDGDGIDRVTISIPASCLRAASPRVL